MVNNMKKILTTFILIFATFSSYAQSTWDAPFTINNKNSEIKFEVDSTFVLVKGLAKNFHGKSYYADASKPDSLVGDVIISVPDLNTGLRMRDDHMYEIMASEKYPEIQVKIISTESNCNPDVALKQGSCLLKQKALLKIRNVEKEIPLITKVKPSKTGFTGTGNFEFNWADYNIEDPSTFFATVYPVVKIIYTLNIPRAKEGPKA
jgi:polyisoprenoid-binding protein YceI